MIKVYIVYLVSAVLQVLGCHSSQCRVEVVTVPTKPYMAVYWDVKQYENKTNFNFHFNLALTWCQKTFDFNTDQSDINEFFTSLNGNMCKTAFLSGDGLA